MLNELIIARANLVGDRRKPKAKSHHSARPSLFGWSWRRILRLTR